MSRMRRNRALPLASTGAGQPVFFALGGLQIQDPHSPARGVVGTLVVLDHRAPGLQRAHRERVSLEAVPQMVTHFIRVPVIREDSVTRVHAQDGVVTVERGFGPYFARRPALLAFVDYIAFLRFGSSRRRGCFGTHIVCPPVSVSAAAAILT